MSRGLALVVLSLLLVGCNTDENISIGTLEWDRVELIAEVSEPIVEILVKEGTQVYKGDSLLHLDDRRMRAQLAEAEAARAQAAARLAELERGPRSERIVEARARLDGARKNLEIRERELTRQLQLVKEKLSSPEAVDNARRQRDAARAERDQARAALDELEHGTTTEELDQARQNVARTEAEVERLKVSVERLTIRAPVDGRLDDLPYKLGEQPAVNNVVAVMLTGTHPYARVYVPEALRVHVTPGTRARIHVDGLDQALEGVVRKVSSDPSFTPYFALTERDRGRLSYVAEIDLAEGADLPAGVPVEAVFPEGTSPGSPGQ
jgi:HlyD family secretion protein